MQVSFRHLADELQAQQRKVKSAAESTSYLEQSLRQAQNTRRHVSSEVRHVDVSAYVRYAARHNFLSYLADSSTCPDVATVGELNRRLRHEFHDQRSRKAHILAELDEVSSQTAAAAVECRSICAALDDRLQAYRDALPAKAVQADALAAQTAAATRRLEEATQMEAFTDLELKAVQHEIDSLEREIAQEQADGDECNWQLKRLQQQLQEMDDNVVQPGGESGGKISAVHSKTVTSLNAFGDLLHSMSATTGSGP